MQSMTDVDSLVQKWSLEIEDPTEFKLAIEFYQTLTHISTGEGIPKETGTKISLFLALEGACIFMSSREKGKSVEDSLQDGRIRIGASVSQLVSNAKDL